MAIGNRLNFIEGFESSVDENWRNISVGGKDGGTEYRKRYLSKIQDK